MEDSQGGQHVNREIPYLCLIPICITNKDSYAKSKTKEFDTLAFKYLSWALYPLLIGYAIYSLIYEEHKGWYSWVLSMLYGFLLTFGEHFTNLESYNFVKLSNCLLYLIYSIDRFHHDDPSVVHQLQTQVGGSLAVAYDDLQSVEYFIDYDGRF